MKRKSLFWIGVALALILPALSLGQQKESKTLQVFADYSAFRLPGDSADSYVEIHYNLRRSQLKFEPTEKGYEAMINFGLILRDEGGKILDSISWKGRNQIQKLSELDDRGYMISDMRADRIPPGNYRVELSAANGDMAGQANFRMLVPSYNKREPSLSTIELAYRISPDSVGKFVKNGLLVMPNPSGQFLRENGKINVYAEGYGLDTSSVADSLFYVTMEILAPAGQLVRSFAPVSYQKPGESAVIATNFPIDTLSPGDYNLKLVMTDGNVSVFTTRQFSIGMRRETARRAMLRGVLRDFPEADNITNDDEARKFRDEITYIASNDELKVYDSLNLTGKASYQKDFWARRNTDSSSGQNDFELEHYRRFKYANDTFGQFQGGHAGWRTDRGRVYILYGEPSEIERTPQSISDRAWEQWNYNSLEGGVYFIFIDMENAADYTLVHSSKTGEPKDYNWTDKITMGINQR